MHIDYQPFIKWIGSVDINTFCCNNMIILKSKTSNSLYSGVWLQIELHTLFQYDWLIF